MYSYESYSHERLSFVFRAWTLFVWQIAIIGSLSCILHRFNVVVFLFYYMKAVADSIRPIKNLKVLKIKSLDLEKGSLYKGGSGRGQICQFAAALYIKVRAARMGIIGFLKHLDLHLDIHVCLLSETGEILPPEQLTKQSITRFGLSGTIYKLSMN